MTLAQYNAFCRSLPQSTHVVQWGDAHVWKIGGKVFAIGGWNGEDDELFVTFKCSPMSFEMLKDEPGCRPAPYLASRGFTWIQRVSRESLSDKALKEYISESYRLVMPNALKKQMKA